MLTAGEVKGVCVCVFLCVCVVREGGRDCEGIETSSEGHL